MKSSITRLTALLTVLFLVAGCVGGGGDGNVTGSGSNNGGNGSTGGTVTPVATPKIFLSLTDKSSSAAVTSISPNTPAIATVTLVDSVGAPVKGAIVTFTIANTSLATLTPAVGTVLTDASGLAKIQVSAASISSEGGTSITAASATAKSVTDSTPVPVSATTNFSVTAAAASLANLSNGLAAGATLDPYSTTSISATVVGVPTTTPMTVSFSSVCATAGKAVLPTTVNTVNGVATATYTDNACAAQDTITVSIVGTSVSQTVLLTVKQPAATSIQFVSSTPSVIGIVGVGNPVLPSSAIVSFKVVDNSNHPVPSIPVSFGLSTRAGGIMLNGAASGTVSQLTDATGTASVQVTAGTLPTPVSVTASTTVNGRTLSSQSNLLTITTGRPTQDRTSIGVGTFNIEGWDYIGTTTPVSVTLADRLGNPVPDGTVVNFVADGGIIEAKCSTSGGLCSATFGSANTKGIGKTEPFGLVTAGRVQVLAYAVGEESFRDFTVAGAATNDNNVYNAGEPYNDLGDVFMDSNENGVYDNGEFTIVSGNTSTCAGSGIATSPYAPSRANTCDGAWGTSYVRQDATIVLSGSTAYIGTGLPTATTVVAKSATSATTMGGTCGSTTHFFRAYDINKNPLPAGTTIAVAAGYPSIVKPTINPNKITNTPAPGGTPHSLGLTVDLTANADGTTTCVPLTGTVTYTLTFTTPRGNISTATFSVAP